LVFFVITALDFALALPRSERNCIPVPSVNGELCFEDFGFMTSHGRMSAGIALPMPTATSSGDFMGIITAPLVHGFSALTLDSEPFGILTIAPEWDFCIEMMADPTHMDPSCLSFGQIRPNQSIVMTDEAGSYSISPLSSMDETHVTMIFSCQGCVDRNAGSITDSSLSSTVLKLIFSAVNYTSEEQNVFPLAGSMQQEFELNLVSGRTPEFDNMMSMAGF